MNLAKKVVSVLQKELEYQVQEVGGHAGGSETNRNFQLVNKPFDHTTTFAVVMINTIIYKRRIIRGRRAY